MSDRPHVVVRRRQRLEERAAARADANAAPEAVDASTAPLEAVTATPPRRPYVVEAPSRRGRWFIPPRRRVDDDGLGRALRLVERYQAATVLDVRAELDAVDDALEAAAAASTGDALRVAATSCRTLAVALVAKAAVADDAARRASP